MEEQTLLFKENLINIRRILVSNRKKLKKLSSKRELAENQLKQKKKFMMREKILETPRKINKAVTAGNAKKAKGMGLGNALGLFAIIIIASNFEKVKKLFNNFITGDTFKNIKNYFTGTIDFFKGLYDGLSGNYGELLGEKYDQLVAFKNEKISEIEELTTYLKQLQKNFVVLAEQANELKNKFLNMMGVATNSESTDNTEKPYNGLYEKGEDGNYYNIFDGTPLPAELGGKENNNTSDKVAKNIGLTDINQLALNNNPLDYDNNQLPIKMNSVKNSEFDLSQYNDDLMNTNTTIITKTNTVIT